MTDTAAAIAGSLQQDGMSGKRQRVLVHLESGGEGYGLVHQMNADGTYVPAEDSHFARTSAEAAAFVARSLAEQSELEKRQGDLDPKWTEAAFTSVEGALYEMGRVVAVIEALRGETPLLELRRSVNRNIRQKVASAAPTLPASTIKDAPAMLMAKRRALQASASLIADRAANLRNWVKEDNDFCDAFLYLRAKASGIRRSPTGAPLIDVGNGNFVPVQRVSKPASVLSHGSSSVGAAQLENAMVDVNVDADMQTNDDLPLQSRKLVHVETPPDTYFCFGLSRLEHDFKSTAAPVVLENSESTTKGSLEAVLRRIRLARVSSFRRLTFDRMAREAAEMSDAIDFTTNSISLESGPYDVLRVERTMRRISPSIAIGTKPSEKVPNFRDIQDASVLQIISLHAALVAENGGLPAKSLCLFDRVLGATCAQSVLRALEKVLDDIVKLLGVRVVWSRGSSRLEEARVCVWSSSADGDGPDRSLLTIEPLSSLNNGGDAWCNGHVRVTPAYGVIIPAPDDPIARGRAAVLPAQSSSSSGASSTIGLDDVPRSYVCPVLSGGEIVSAVTLLLCIRLLDALELAARAGEPEVLDVDRQCFVVVVSAPQTGRTLRVKVWPKGSEPGKEVPGTTAWFNGQLVKDFPPTSPGRLAAWRKLLRRLVDESTPSPSKNSGDAVMTDAPSGSVLSQGVNSMPHSNVDLSRMSNATQAALVSAMQRNMDASLQGAMDGVPGSGDTRAGQGHAPVATANGHLNLNGFM